MPSSAQWMSSIASTSGFWRHAPSTRERTAEKIRSRMPCASSAPMPTWAATISSGTSIPSGRAMRAASRSTGSSVTSSDTSPSIPRLSLPQASSESSVSTMSNVLRTISPSAQ